MKTLSLIMMLSLPLISNNLLSTINNDAKNRHAEDGLSYGTELK